MAGMVQTRSAAIIAARNPDHLTHFRTGISCVFSMWTALELALFHKWGGSTGSDLASELQNEIIDMLMKPAQVYKDDISYLIEDYMRYAFNTECEDGSPDEIGAILCDMWRQCCEGNFELVANVQQKAQQRASAVNIAQSQGVSNGDAMDSDDDDDDMNIAEHNQHLMDQNMEAYGGHSFGNAAAGGGAKSDDSMGMGMNMVMEEEDQEPQPPLVDEDGFETVLVGKKKKGRGKN